MSVSVENIVVREECRDNPHFANCKLIVKARSVTHLAVVFGGKCPKTFYIDGFMRIMIVFKSLLSADEQAI